MLMQKMTRVVMVGMVLGLAASGAQAANPNWAWGNSASAAAFEDSMENPQTGILHENFPLTRHTVVFKDARAFDALVANRVALRDFVANRVAELCITVMRNPVKKCEAGKAFIRGSWVDEYNSGFVGAYALSTVFIGVDEDNWFGFDDVTARTMPYLSGSTSRLLRLYKGFRSGGIITAGGSSLDDLVVVVDTDELTITLLTAELFD